MKFRDREAYNSYFSNISRIGILSDAFGKGIPNKKDSVDAICVIVFGFTVSPLGIFNPYHNKGGLATKSRTNFLRPMLHI